MKRVRETKKLWAISPLTLLQPVYVFLLYTAIFESVYVELKNEYELADANQFLLWNVSDNLLKRADRIPVQIAEHNTNGQK